MRPPICEVCGDRFGPSDGALLSFADDDRSRAFAERRTAEPGFVGHPPNTGWFCATHVTRASELTALTLDAALADMAADDTVIDDTVIDDENDVVQSVARPRPTVAPHVTPQPGTPQPATPQPGRQPAARASRRDTAGRSIEFTLPIKPVDVFELHDVFQAVRPLLLEFLSIPDDVELTIDERRTWNPMDGAREPNCPYSDRTIRQAKRGRFEHGVEVESNWWNPEDLANASVRLFVIDRPDPTAWGRHLCRLSAAAQPVHGARPMVDEIDAVVDAAVTPGHEAVRTWMRTVLSEHGLGSSAS